MSNKCRTTQKNTICKPVTQTPVAPACAPFSACLSFGRSLYFNGTCFSEQGTPTVGDGWYGEVNVVNGCIVGARVAEVPTYTPAPCAPAAGSCGEDGGGGGGGGGCPPLSPNAKNLSYCTSGALMTELVFGTLDGIEKSGAGTRNDPLNLSVTGGGGGGGRTYITNGSPSALSLTGSGSLSDAYIIGMQDSPLGAGVYGPFTIDQYGRVIDYDSDADSGGVKTLVDGDGTTAFLGGGVGRIDLADTGVTSGSYVFGGNTATVNTKGQLTNVQRTITITGDTYRLGDYDVTLNALGSVTKIEEATPEPPPVGVATTFFVQFAPETGIASSREFEVTTPVSGHLRVVYTGYIQPAPEGSQGDAYPGLAPTPLNPNGVTLRVNGTVVPNSLVTIQVANPDPVITGIQGVTPARIPAGTHIITVEAGRAIVSHHAVCTVDIVGLGA